MVSELATYENPITTYLGGVLKHLFDTMEERLTFTLKKMCELLNQIMGANLDSNGLEGLKRHLNYLSKIKLLRLLLK